MTDVAAGKAQAHATGLAATLGHVRYVLGENPVTGFAFGLFVLIVLAALFGPYLVPYDPLASNTAQALKPPSAAHWFGTDQLGRDILSRVIVATRLDFVIAVSSVALVFLMGGLAGVAAGFFGGWTDRIVSRIADTIMAFPLFVLAMGIVAALGNTVHQHRHRHRHRQLPALRPRRPRRGQRAPRGRLRAGGAAVRQRRVPHPARPRAAQHHADHDRADVADHGLRHPQRRRPVVHRPRRAPADAGVGHHGGGRARPSWSRASGGSPSSPARR